jgi:MFS family permease
MLPMHRQVLLLAATQALFQTASAMVVTVGALAGAQIATPALATVPIASMIFGTATTIIPASMWMARKGRRNGFLLGTILGVLGALVAAWGIHSNSLLVLATGCWLIGAYQGFAQFYRFAASEIATEDFRPRAISWVMAGGVVAAFLGPGMGLFGAKLVGAPYAGSFLLLALSCVIAGGLLWNLVVLLASHVAVSASGTSLPSFVSALVLLGVGWNFLYVGGTTLLTGAYLPAERARAQATNDFIVYLVGLAASLSAGVLLELVGWRNLNLLLLPWLLLAVVAVFWLRRTRRD